MTLTSIMAVFLLRENQLDVTSFVCQSYFAEFLRKYIAWKAVIFTEFELVYLLQ